MKSIKCEWSKGLRGEGLLTWENSYRCQFHSGETTWYFHTGMIIYKRGCFARFLFPPPPPPPPPIHVPRVDTISDWQKLRKGNPIWFSDKPIFYQKEWFLLVYKTLLRDLHWNKTYSRKRMKSIPGTATVLILGHPVWFVPRDDFSW